MLIVWTLVALLGGALFWSFSEYALHNWWGHLAKGKNDFSREHLAHHAQKDYFTPHTKKVRTAIPPVILVGALAVWSVGWVLGVGFTTGFLAMYVLYEVTHYRLHVVPPRGWYSRWARKHHFSHHFNCPKMNHGVTSPIWDWVFRTYQDPGQVRVPAKMAMDWLLDDSGQVRPEFQQDYFVKVAAVTRQSQPQQLAA